MVVHNDNLMAPKYHDRKKVYLETATMKDTGRERRGERVKKPNVVMEYDKYMGGVDRADQMLNYTPFRGKTVKRWKRVFFHVVNICVMNSYLMYKSATAQPITGRKFQTELVEFMISSVSLDELLARR